MKLKLVYKICPVLVKYTDTKTKGFAGMSYGVFIKIQKSYKDDIGLLEHELTHSRQFYRTLGISAILYQFKTWRYEYELKAYRVQLKYAHNKDWAAGKFAGFIANRYNIAVDVAKVKEELLK